MPCEFRTVQYEMDHEAYMDYLLRHNADLNLPYPFDVKLSFISSPLFLGKAMLVHDEETNQMVGAAGFVYGTGPEDYADQHVCQVEVVHLEENRRSGILFLQLMRALIGVMQEEHGRVSLVQFWASDDPPGNKRLFDKLASLPGSSRTLADGLTLYRVPFQELEAYCSR